MDLIPPVFAILAFGRVMMHVGRASVAEAWTFLDFNGSAAAPEASLAPDYLP